MPTHESWGKEGGHFFCTFTCWEWLSLIEVTGLYDSIYAWMHLVTAKGCAITGYVIMPNHVHLLMFVPEGMAVNTLLANAKRFLAYEVISRLKEHGEVGLLAQLVTGLLRRQQRS